MKIGITNLKGGVGKTTLSTNLAVCFAHMGYKVCIVDTDTNQNSMTWYATRSEELPHVFVTSATQAAALQKTVATLHEQYDIVIIDGTPNLTEMNTRVIASSNLLLIPTRPGVHDFRAMGEFMLRLEQIQQVYEGITAAFVINEYDERFILHKTVLESLSQQYSTPICETRIKSRTVYNEANFNGTGVYEERDEKAKQEMVSLTSEVIQMTTTQLHQYLKTEILITDKTDYRNEKKDYESKKN